MVLNKKGYCHKKNLYANIFSPWPWEKRNNKGNSILDKISTVVSSSEMITKELTCDRPQC